LKEIITPPASGAILMDPKVLKSLTRAAIFGMILGCTEQQSPVAPLSIPARLTIVPPSAQAVDLPVGSVNNPANTVILPTFTYPVIVELRLEGTIYTTSRPDTYLHAYTGALDGSGIFTYSVFYQCGANVTFRFSVSGTRMIGPCLYDPIPKASWADTALVEGTASLTRNYGIPQFTEDCQYNPCHSYFGTQTAYVTPLPAALQLAPSATQVDSGQTVVFTASASPSSIKGLQVPVKVLSWRWIASDGGTGQTIACSIPSNPCSAIIRESGAMELTALANGAEQVVSASVMLNGSQVKIVPDQPTMKGTIILDPPEYFYRHEISKQLMSVSVVDANGAPIRNKSVDLSQTATENTAGHRHIGNKPVGELNGATSTTVNTGDAGVIRVEFRAPEVSGPITITGKSSGATTGTASIDIGIPGLEQLFAGPGYALYGDNGWHPDNHWATGDHIAKLQTLAALYSARWPAGLRYNDSSLPRGGLFDWDVAKSPWSPPHGGHREGMNTDLKIAADATIGYKALTGGQKAVVRAIWIDSLKQAIGIEGDHYHLRPRRADEK
jgi:hypothetical protein